MSETNLIVVDWTSSVLEVGVFARNLRGYELRSHFTTPTRTGLRQRPWGKISYLLGADAVGQQEDKNTIIFRNPGRELPRIEDVDLQTELLKSFWQGLHEFLIRREVLAAEQVAPVYVIPPLRFPLPLLEKLRSCASETPLQLRGTTTAAAALVMGILGLPEFVADLNQMAGSEQTTAGCFVAREESIEAVCFNYQSVGPSHHRIIIRDFFQTTLDELSPRLSDSDCFDSLDVLLLVEDPELSDSARDQVKTSLGQIAGATERRQRQLPTATSLKLMGGAEVARFAAGRATEPSQYELSHLCNLGVQINRSRFYPLIGKERLRSCKFPTSSSQSFNLVGEPTGALRLNFCFGYSTRIAEAIPLGHMVLSESELTALADDSFLSASIRLDRHGSGEFFLGVMPENRILRQQPFMMPGLA